MRGRAPPHERSALQARRKVLNSLERELGMVVRHRVDARIGPGSSAHGERTVPKQ